MNIYPRRPLFNRKPQSNVYRMFLWVIMLLAGVWLLRQLNQGEVKPFFLPTPIPTRNAESYKMEGDANFSAGKVDDAIAAYREVVRLDPNNAQVWADLARIQTYSTAFLTTDPERKTRLAEALQSADKAVELAPDDSRVHAIRAFVLDWNANPALVGDKQAQEYLNEAEQEALRAQQIDNTNALALAYYAEILVDQQKWTQAEQYIKQALDRDPSLMDVHRVYAYVLETLGQYNLAITEYDKAIAIEPNFTFLYLRAGANYRRIAFGIAKPEDAQPVYEKSLDYFDKAAKINDQIGVKDTTPYTSIAKTYSQMGQFFIAARNIQKALIFKPTDPDLYGQLGIIYFKSRNYEGSIPALKCAIRGCSGQESCAGRGECGPGESPVTVTGLPLSPNSIVYYYTYGSVLAALSRPRANQCPDALAVFAEVKAEVNDPAKEKLYSDGRQTILNIVQAGESICASLADSGAPVSGSANEAATSTPEVGMIETVTPTP